VRLLATGIGYLVVAFAVFAVLDVSIDHLLVGAGLAGVVLGIAAQQSLGNVFAALVLLLAKAFKVGDHVRIRSGALGGIFDAWVLEVRPHLRDGPHRRRDLKKSQLGHARGRSRPTPSDAD